MVFSEEQLDKYARVMIWGMKKARGDMFRQGDYVLLRTGISGLPLARLVNRYLLQGGMIPVVRIASPEDMEKDFFSLSESFQLESRIPGDSELYSHLSGAISILASE